MTKLWVVFQMRGEVPEFQGVFSSEEKAIKACRTELYCVCGARLDEELEAERVEFDYCWYPMSESAPVAAKELEERKTSHG